VRSVSVTFKRYDVSRPAAQGGVDRTHERSHAAPAEIRAALPGRKASVFDSITTPGRARKDV
jgi:hypothetical protein